jgi:hypothetical protein
LPGTAIAVRSVSITHSSVSHSDRTRRHGTMRADTSRERQAPYDSAHFAPLTGDQGYLSIPQDLCQNDVPLRLCRGKQPSIAVAGKLPDPDGSVSAWTQRPYCRAGAPHREGCQQRYAPRYMRNFSSPTHRLFMLPDYISYTVKRGVPVRRSVRL